MNHKQLFITVSCLLLFAASGMAQQPAEPTQDELLRMQMGALGEQFHAGMQIAMMKAEVRLLWNGQGANWMVFAGAMSEPEIATAWGISEEQIQQVIERWDATMEQMGYPMDAVSLRLLEAMGLTEEEADDWVPDAETIGWLQDNLFGIMEDTLDAMSSMVDTTIADAFDEFLTPEQLRTMQEAQLANIGKLPFFSPNMFEALNLTDAQREQMEQIKQELQPELEALLENWVDGIMASLNEEYSEFEEESYEELLSRGRAFATQFKIAMFDVLTVEQWIRLQNLIDNPPEHALAFRKVLRELLGVSDEESENEESAAVGIEAGGMWIPGPNAWRPGDAIPEAYRIERNTRRQFPRGEE
ncbi:MAG: hypothetical protein FWE95_06340 [Planctomycetaceae bacterium]|nr:hypothetical protein [Planctomycetaceae bacterium]